MKKTRAFTNLDKGNKIKDCSSPSPDELGGEGGMRWIQTENVVMVMMGPPSSQSSERRGEGGGTLAFRFDGS
jgi:hypothetical protein